MGTISSGDHDQAAIGRCADGVDGGAEVDLAASTIVLDRARKLMISNERSLFSWLLLLLLLL